MPNYFSKLSISAFTAALIFYNAAAETCEVSNKIVVGMFNDIDVIMNVRVCFFVLS